MPMRRRMAVRIPSNNAPDWEPSAKSTNPVTQFTASRRRVMPFHELRRLTAGKRAMSPTTPVCVSIGHLLGIAAHGSRRLCADGFVLALAGVILSATLLPCTGATAAACHAAGTVAIGSLFFLQGARLSRESIVNGIAHWRLHCLIASTTFMLFPIIGLTLT